MNFPVSSRRPTLALLLAAFGLAFAAVASAGNEAKVPLKTFLLSTEGTYGWEPVDKAAPVITYDFFPDGRLHIQGPDGEATMWEGKWSVRGDQVTLVNRTEGTTKTVTARVDGKFLLLGAQRYRRSKPVEP